MKQRSAVAVGTWYSGCDKSREGQGNFFEKETLEKVSWRVSCSLDWGVFRAQGTLHIPGAKG